MIYRIPERHGGSLRQRLRLSIPAEQCFPCHRLTGKRVADVIEQYILRILTGDFPVGVYIACKLLLFGKSALETGHSADIFDQCKLGVIDADAAVIVDVTEQEVRKRLLRLTRCDRSRSRCGNRGGRLCRG